MKVLLDTHAFLWWIVDDARLSPRAREIIEDGDNAVCFSAASAWEIAIKARLGRIELPGSLERFIPRQLERNHFAPLPVHVSHALRVHDLPDHHRDPFDRLLIAQSQLERLPILTSNRILSQYDVETIW